MFPSFDPAIRVRIPQTLSHSLSVDPLSVWVWSAPPTTFARRPDRGAEGDERRWGTPTEPARPLRVGQFGLSFGAVCVESKVSSFRLWSCVVLECVVSLLLLRCFCPLHVARWRSPHASYRSYRGWLVGVYDGPQSVLDCTRIRICLRWLATAYCSSPPLSGRGTEGGRRRLLRLDDPQLERYVTCFDLDQLYNLTFHTPEHAPHKPTQTTHSGLLWPAELNLSPNWITMNYHDSECDSDGFWQHPMMNSSKTKHFCTMWHEMKTVNKPQKHTHTLSLLPHKFKQPAILLGFFAQAVWFFVPLFCFGFDRWTFVSV